jgi:hypothetical protein
MLSWQTMVSPGAPPTMKTTNVSYRYVARSGAYHLLRVQCDRPTGGTWACRESVVSRNIMAPPAGTTFTAGTTYPSWAASISQPLDPLDPGTGQPIDAGSSTAKGATRVSLMVHGGSTQGGTTGGVDQVVITAGSTKLVNDLDPASMDGAPSFGALRSRCGGNFGLIVDASNSIGGDLPKIKTGLLELVETFQDTPIKLQLVTFNDRGWIIGGANGSKSVRWYDMLVAADVTALKSGINAIGLRFGTNYEEGLFRMFRNNDGTQQDTIPDTVLFFTDGQVHGNRSWTNEPTRSRTWDSTAAPLSPPLEGSTKLSAGVYNNQWSEFRARYIANLYRDITTRFIGVGVGTVSRSVSFQRSIAQMVSGTDTGVPATKDATGRYTNADVANVYMLPEWEKFASALEAIALAKCGGTLTVQTLMGGVPFDYPVSYQNTAAKLASGADADVNLATVTTSVSYPSGTFDYAIASGGYLTVDIMPASLSDLDGFSPVGWSCRARGVDRAFTTIPIAGSAFTGIRVRVNVNEALSCKLTVT